MIDLWIPWPPTTNTMLTVWRGRKISSERYKEWISQAQFAVQQQRIKPVNGPVEIFITLSSPTKRGYDLDNRVKPILDLLVGLNLIEDDAMHTVTKITVEVGHGFTGALVLVKARERLIQNQVNSHAEEKGLHPVSEMEA